MLARVSAEALGRSIWSQIDRSLGHKSLKSTEIYINIERTLFEPSRDEFTVKAADKAEEVKAFLEVGFEYVCQQEGLMFLRKRL
jgi:hypothetical protein